MSGLPYEFTDKKVSPCVGRQLVKEANHLSGLKQYQGEQYPPLPSSGINCGYSSVYPADGFMVNSILGANWLPRLGILSNDEVIQPIFGWDKRMSIQSTLRRFYRKFDQELNDLFSQALNRFLVCELNIDKMTNDLNSTMTVRHGNQEGVAKGNKIKRCGLGPNHSLIAFVAETIMVAKGWLRTGDFTSSTDFKELVHKLLIIIPPDRFGLFRSDIGFCNETNLSRQEKEKPKFIISTRLMRAFTMRIFTHKERILLGDRYWVAIFNHQGKEWSKPSWMVLVRKDASKHHDNRGKLTFPEIQEFRKVKYLAFATKGELTADLVLQSYNQYPVCEKLIRELKNDYGIEGIFIEAFYAKKTAFRWTLLGHILNNLFRLQVLNQKLHSVLSTMRFRCATLRSYLVKPGQKWTLKSSGKQKHRQFLDWLISKKSNLSVPFSISMLLSLTIMTNISLHEKSLHLYFSFVATDPGK